MNPGNNYAQSFIFNDLYIRGCIVKLNEVYQEIIYLQNVNSNAEKIIGEVLIAAAIMIQAIKIDSQITVQFQSKDENIKLVAAKVDTNGKLRATIRCNKSPSEALLGQGHLVVTIDKIKNKINNKPESYQSIIEIKQGQTIANSLQQYFVQSEQLPSIFKFICNHQIAAGIMIQQTQELVNKNDWDTVVVLFNSLTEQELIELDNKIILHRLFNEYDLTLYPEKSLNFECTCNLNKMQNAIKSLGEQEAMDILTTRKVIEVTCDYCKTHYNFAQSDIKQIFSKH